MSFLNKLFGKDKKLKKQLISLLKQNANEKIPTSIRYQDKTYYITPRVDSIELKADGEQSISIAKSSFMDIKSIIAEAGQLLEEYNKGWNEEKQDIDRLNNIRQDIASLIKECNIIINDRSDEFKSVEEIGEYNFKLGLLALDIDLPQLAGPFFMCAVGNGCEDKDRCQTLMAHCMLEDEGAYEAIETLQTVITRNPEYTLAWNHLARAYATIGKVGKAGKCILKAVSLEKNLIDLYEYYSILGEFLKDLNKEEWANHFIELSEKEELSENTPQILEEVTAYFEELACKEE
ncbi:MAG: hypothetical protein LUH10_07375 [Tannerellaceae bacterium]|nr:hypothetical protein [Tannerellaceae bacterium]